MFETLRIGGHVGNVLRTKQLFKQKSINLFYNVI